MDNKELVLRAITDVFVNRDTSAFDKYFDANYIQHNPHLPNGIDFLKQFIPQLANDFRYEPGVVTENGEFVMVHGRYENWNGKNMIAVDIFKVRNGRLIEHWDVMQEEIIRENSANGNSMFPIS
jgi:predicted SnoaL-like aldol condensation-catalyzing enzyme